MYPRIPWKLVTDPLGSAQHTLGTTALDSILLKTCSPLSQPLNYTQANTITIHVVQSGITFHITNCWQVFMCAYYSQHQLNTQKTQLNILNEGITMCLKIN